MNFLILNEVLHSKRDNHIMFKRRYLLIPNKKYGSSLYIGWLWGFGCEEGGGNEASR